MTAGCLLHLRHFAVFRFLHFVRSDRGLPRIVSPALQESPVFGDLESPAGGQLAMTVFRQSYGAGR